MTRRLRIIFVGLFFALTFVCSAASIYLVFATSLMASYPGWGATPKNGRLIVFKEEEYAARLSALHEGDEVIAFNGQPVKTVAPINKYFSTAELGDYKLTVRRDDGAVQELTLQTLPLPYTTRIGAVISVILVPCLFLLIGFALFVLKPFDKQGLLLALLFAMYAATHSGGFSIAPVWLKVLMAVNVCVAFCASALFLNFTLVFPEPSPLVRRFPRLEWILYAPSLIFFVPIQLFVYGVYFLAPNRYEAARFANIGKASTIVWMLYIGAGICFLINTYRLANQLSRRKLRVVLAGTLAAFAPGMLLYIAAQFVEPSKLKRTIGAWPSLIATASILLLPLSFAYAILRHKVIPVSLIIRRSARYLLVSRGSILLEALAVGLVLAFLMNEFFRYHLWSGSTVGIISAVVSVIVWQFTTVFNKRFIAPVIDRRFFREAYNAQAILADLMRAMRSLTNTRRPTDSPKCLMSKARCSITEKPKRY